MSDWGNDRFVYNNYFDRNRNGVWLIVFLLFVVQLVYATFVNVFEDEFIGTITIIISGILLYNSAKKYGIARIIIIAYIIRVVLGYLHTYGIIIPIIGTMPDSGGNEITFLNLAAEWSTDGFSQVWTHLDIRTHNVYPWVLSVLYMIFDISRLMATAYNVLMGVGIIIITYKITYTLWGQRPAKSSAWILALLPTMISSSIIVLREMVIIILLSQAVWLFIKYHKSGNIYFALSTLALIGLAAIFHGALFLLFIPLLLSFIMRELTNLKKGEITFARFFLLVGGLIFGIALLLSLGIGENKLYMFSAEEGNSADEALLETVSSDIGRERTFSITDDLVFESPIDVLRNYPILLSRYWFKPYFWEYQVGILRLPNGVLYAFILIALFRLYKVIIKDPIKRGLLVLFVTFTIVFSFGSQDTYQSDRHRTKMTFLAVALFAPYLDKLINRRKKMLLGEEE